MMSATEQLDPETRRRFRTFVMRLSWIPVLAACGALGVGGYRLGIGMALWDRPTGSGVIGVLWALPVAALVFLAWDRLVPWSPCAKLMRGALVFLGCIGLMAASCAPESKFLPYPYIDTCFDPGFDRESFERLHPGMSTTEVEAVTWSTHFRRPPRTWGYLLPGHPDLVWVYSSDHCAWFGDYAWRSYQVGFRNGVVVTISTAWRYD